MAKKTTPPPSRQAPARPEADPEGYPSLRLAMWLYLLALMIAAAIIIPLAFSIEGGVLNLIAVLVACVGLTAGAMFMADVHVSAIFGRRPSIRALAVSLLLGLAVWIPASWVQLALYGYITAVVGPLRQPLPSSAAPSAIVLQGAVLFPLCEGLLFWAFFQRAAEGIGRIRGALLTAVAFAIFVTLFSGFVGVTAFPALLIVGLCAAFGTSYTGSAWCGILVVGAYGLASPVLEGTLFTFLGVQFANQFGPRWLMVTVLTAFLSFIMVQILRVLKPADLAVEKRARPRRFWWAPGIVVLLLVLLVTSSEMSLRSSRKPAQPADPNGSVAPPVAIPPVNATSIPAPAPSASGSKAP